ncbi:MAG: sugar phosphate isomerase/epimerase [Bacteroidales bacterium]|nr:sugar phosphate isomerase/epimerase [Bacteroidales bacterium]
MRKNTNTSSGRLSGRRSFIGTAAAFTGIVCLPPWIHNALEISITQVFGKSKIDTYQRYKIGVCDWMLLKRQKPGAFSIASEVGADGLEVDMGNLGNRPTFDNKLLDPVERKKFLEESKKFNIEICSIAMSGFYAQSFAERETLPIMVRDTINTMVMMRVKTAFLPLGVKGDLNQYPELRPAIVERLKMAGQMAEAADVTIGIETALDATGEVQLLKEIGSPAIKSYFNFANALQKDRDLIHELKILGRDRICQIHCTDEDGVWLENNTRINMPEVKKALDEIGWGGWLVVERSRDARNPGNVVGNFGSNVKYLKSIFQT